MDGFSEFTDAVVDHEAEPSMRHLTTLLGEMVVLFGTLLDSAYANLAHTAEPDKIGVRVRLYTGLQLSHEDMTSQPVEMNVDDVDLWQVAGTNLYVGKLNGSVYAVETDGYDYQLVETQDIILSQKYDTNEVAAVLLAAQAT